MEIKFERGENYHIPNEEGVKVTTYKNGRAKVTHIKTPSNNLAKYRRRGNEIINTETGEITECEIHKLKTDKTIKRTMKETIRPLLENNFFGGVNELFVTLTFANDMNDFRELSRYFNNFWNRLKYKYKDLDLDCLAVKEMQQNRKSWHLHLIMKELNNKYLYISNNEMARIWGLGLTKVSRINKEDKQIDEDINEEKSMEHTLYIPNENFNISKVIDYMCKLETKSGEIPSAGRIHIKKGKLELPKIERMIYGDANNTILKDASLVREDTLLLRNPDTEFILNYIHTEEWQLKNNTNNVRNDNTS